MGFVGWYSVLVGMMMLLQWGVFLGTGLVPELETEPLRIGFHLAGEGVTAILLLASGLGVLRQRIWASVMTPVALGMLTYTVIVSPGYFAQMGQWSLVAMFAGLLAVTLYCLARSGREAMRRLQPSE